MTYYDRTLFEIYSICICKCFKLHQYLQETPLCVFRVCRDSSASYL